MLHLALVLIALWVLLHIAAAIFHFAVVGFFNLLLLAALVAVIVYVVQRASDNRPAV